MLLCVEMGLTIMNKITKREQMLLFLLGMVLVIVLFYVLVWTPSQLKKSQGETLKAELEAEKVLMDASLPMYDTFKQQLDDGLASINTELDSIEDNLTAAKFERWIFPLIKEHNAVISSSSFTLPEVASPDSMLYVKNDPMYTVKEMISQINSISFQQSVKPTTESVLLKASYSYEVYLSYNDYASLLSDITSWNTTFFVNKASYNFDDKMGTFTIDAYTIDKFEVSDESRYEGVYPTDGLKGVDDLPEKETEVGTINPDVKGDTDGSTNPENPIIPLPDIEGNK